MRVPCTWIDECAHRKGLQHPNIRTILDVHVEAQHAITCVRTLAVRVGSVSAMPARSSSEIGSTSSKFPFAGTEAWAMTMMARSDTSVALQVGRIMEMMQSWEDALVVVYMQPPYIYMVVAYIYKVAYKS